MSIFEINQNTALSRYDRTGKTMDALSTQLTTGKKINTPKDDPVIWERSQHDAVSVKTLQGTNDGINVVATSIRSADASMGLMNTYVDQMKANLDAVVKNYPPFPPGSQDRIRYLKMFNGLKDQIDELATPRGDKGAQQIMADPSVAPGDWIIPVGENGATVTMRKQEVHTGATGLNIPALSETASDAEVIAARANLDTAALTLESRRAGLGTDAAAITRSQSYSVTIATTQQADSERWIIADMNEVSANYKSAELKHELSLQSAVNLTTMQSQFLELLG
ncbi:MAG: hypothetical protein WC539_10580 [Nitrospirota bacterium]